MMNSLQTRPRYCVNTVHFHYFKPLGYTGFIKMVYHDTSSGIVLCDGLPVN